MRERIARTVSVLVVLVLAVLALVFSWAHNPPVQAIASPPTARAPGPPEAEESLPPPSVTGVPQDEDLETGRTIYMDQACATCHSIEGVGNPRYPLDGVASRWEPDEIRAWVTGGDFAADLLAEAIVRRKQRYQELPDEALDALVLYLSNLKTEQ